MRLVPELSSYEACVQAFRWEIPARFNIAHAVCTRHAERAPDKIALIEERDDGEVRRYAFGGIEKLSSRLAHAMRAAGVARGDRVAVILSQSLECLIAHLAILKLAAIGVPLSILFGPEGLRHRLDDSGARMVVTHSSGCEAIATVRDELPALETIFCVDGAGAGGALDLWQAIERGDDRFAALQTAPADPAMLIYTSGTTGLAKGALHGHQVLLGHLPGIEFALGFFPKPDDLYWSPADWSWVAGLLDVLLPSLYHGVPVLARRFPKFDPQAAFDLLVRHKVRNLFATPTALKMMRQVTDAPYPGLELRSLCSGGEAVGDAVVDWCRDALGVTPNEIYGQTEVNLVVVGNDRIIARRSGAIGRATPGHEVAIVDDDGNVLPRGSQGQIAARRPDPVMFLEYWRNPDATRDKFIGAWCLTGDLGVQDDDGYFFFRGRADDVINASGYRIGPVEIEACLMQHPAVSLVGVVGKPDAERGEIVKAFIVAAEDCEPSDALKKELQTFVRERLAGYQYPREITFLDEMPTTVSNKIRRSALRELG